MSTQACSNCRKPIRTGARFCVRCGTSVAIAPALPPVAPATVLPPPRGSPDRVIETRPDRGARRLVLGIVGFAVLLGSAMIIFHDRPEPPPPSNVTVGPGGDFATITAALSAVGTGSTVRVRAGNYYESIVLDKPITLIGEGPRSAIVLKSDKSVTIKSSGVVLHGLTIRCVTPAGSTDSALFITEGPCKVEQCDISSESISSVIVAGPTAVAVFDQCDIHGHQNGLFAYDRSHVTVNDCTLHHNTFNGVDVTSDADVRVNNSFLIHNSRYGVCVTVNDQKNGVTGAPTAGTCHLSHTVLTDNALGPWWSPGDSSLIDDNGTNTIDSK